MVEFKFAFLPRNFQRARRFLAVRLPDVAWFSQLLEHHSLWVGGERSVETLGRNNIRIFLADRTKLSSARVIFESVESVTAQDRELRFQVEEDARESLELKSSRLLAMLIQNVGGLAIKPDNTRHPARPGLRKRIPEETFRAVLIKGFTVHDLRKDRLGVDEQNMVGGVGGRAVPAGGKLLGNSRDRMGSRKKNELVAGIGAAGEEIRNPAMDVRFGFVELNGVTSGIR